jgi:hypothetical protein
MFNTWLGNLGNGENIEETKFLSISRHFLKQWHQRFEDITRIRQADGEVTPKDS